MPANTPRRLRKRILPSVGCEPRARARAPATRLAQRCSSPRNPRRMRSGVNGSSRNRTPVASKIALAIAAALGTDADSPTPSGGWSWPRQHQHVDLGHVRKFDDRVGAPFAARHRIAVERDLLHQRAAGRLDHVAVDLVAHAVRIDHQAGILPGHHARHADIAGRLVDGDVGDPGRPRRADSREICCAHRAHRQSRARARCRLRPPAPAVPGAASSRRARRPR